MEIQLAFLATVEKVSSACHLCIHFTLRDWWVCAVRILLHGIFLLVLRVTGFFTKELKKILNVFIFVFDESPDLNLFLKIPLF